MTTSPSNAARAGASVAALFPGQGSGADDLRARAEAVRPDLVEATLAAVGDDPFARSDESTEFAQPAIFCGALVGYELMREREPALYAGHSLGELAALTAAGALSEEDGVRLAVARGRLTAQAAAASGEPGGMTAVLGGDDEAVRAVAERHGLTVANENAPGQLVLSGDRSALGTAGEELQEAGARVRELAVLGAFHTTVMKPAAEAFRALLDEVEVHDPHGTVVSCMTARPFTDVREELAEAILRPVRWTATLEELHRLGARTFVEAGPGKVLAGLVKRTIEDVEIEAISLPEAEAARV
jgi:[acyl-carrier-protein] S-malonyltransferase